MKHPCSNKIRNLFQMALKWLFSKKLPKFPTDRGFRFLDPILVRLGVPLPTFPLPHLQHALELHLFSQHGAHLRHFSSKTIFGCVLATTNLQPFCWNKLDLILEPLKMEPLTNLGPRALQHINPALNLECVELLLHTWNIVNVFS